MPRPPAAPSPSSPPLPPEPGARRPPAIVVGLRAWAADFLGHGLFGAAGGLAVRVAAEHDDRKILTWLPAVVFCGAAFAASAAAAARRAATPEGDRVAPFWKRLRFRPDAALLPPIVLGLAAAIPAATFLVIGWALSFGDRRPLSGPSGLTCGIVAGIASLSVYLGLPVVTRFLPAAAAASIENLGPWRAWLRAQELSRDQGGVAFVAMTLATLPGAALALYASLAMFPPLRRYVLVGCAASAVSAMAGALYATWSRECGEISEEELRRDFG